VWEIRETSEFRRNGIVYHVSHGSPGIRDLGFGASDPGARATSNLANLANLARKQGVFGGGQDLSSNLAPLDVPPRRAFRGIPVKPEFFEFFEFFSPFAGSC
jgi:hypothetical protein